jgi:hypothetical protein
MQLIGVTITGADDSVDPVQLMELSREFPFVEWGILFGRAKGVPRFPSRHWLVRLMSVAVHHPLKLSAHLCSHWCRSIVLHGDPTWWDANFGYKALFQRVQFNFHGRFHEQHPAFADIVDRFPQERFILQCDGVNDAAARDLIKSNPKFQPLFDRSGGAGRVPAFWPEAWPGTACGYAGGLGPYNVVEQLDSILPRWITTCGSTWSVACARRTIGNLTLTRCVASWSNAAHDNNR